MSKENPLWGAPRIQAELNLLGFNVAESTVAKYRIKKRKPPSQTWKTFLSNHAHDIAGIDFFTIPTATFRNLYCFAFFCTAAGLIQSYLERLPSAMKKKRFPDGAETEYCIYTPHSLRTTTAALLLDASVDIRKVKDLLGHRHTTTQIYDKRRIAASQSASRSADLIVGWSHIATSPLPL